MELKSYFFRTGHSLRYQINYYKNILSNFPYFWSWYIACYICSTNSKKEKFFKLNLWKYVWVYVY